MNADDRARILAAQADRLKEACLTLSREAVKLFDLIDQRGAEGAMDGNGILVIISMRDAHEELRSYFASQATMRLAATHVGRQLLGEILSAPHTDGSGGVS